MRNLRPIRLAAVAVAGLMAVAAGQLSAGEPGVVRISDAGDVRPAAHSSGVTSSAEYVGSPDGGCTSCGDGYGDGYDGGYGSGNHRCRCLACLRALLAGHNSPDHGWGRPIKRPIHELPVLYQKYWPDAWYGQAGSGYGGVNVHYHPMVYMPTDTTQLGYYYQRVPFWRPNPDMTPPVPWPAHWHRRECGAYPVGHDFLGGGNGSIIGVDGGIGLDGYGQPGCQNGAAPDLQPVPGGGNGESAPSDPPPIPETVHETARNPIR